MARSVATTRTGASRRRSAVNFPYSLKFNGNTQRVVLDSNNTFVSTSTFAISGWVNIGDQQIASPSNTLRGLFTMQTDIGVGYTVGFFGLSSSSTTSVVFLGPAAAGSFPRAALTAGSASNYALRDIIRRGWHMWTLVFDGVDYTALSSYTFYVDTTAYTLAASTSAPSVSNANMIGALNSLGGSTSITLGRIGRCRMWSGGTALTSAQITEMYYDDTAPKTNPTLIREYMFTEGSGTTLTDTSGGGYNGTLTNSPTWVVDSRSIVRTAASTVRSVAS